MSLQQNTDRIQTTHIGSLPRPHNVLDLLKAKLNGQTYDQAALDKAIAEGVRDNVRKQVDCGIDIVTDGEVSKPGFFTYIQNGSPVLNRGPARSCCCFRRKSRRFRTTTRSISRKP